MNSNAIFENLFVLEMTNNHQGNLDRGLAIVSEHSKVVRFRNVRAAIKLQFRDLNTFVHQDFRDRSDIRYIKRITETRLTKEQYGVLIDAIRRSGCIPMATPFDESAVDWCEDFGLPIIKVASADNNDWQLLEKIAKTKKPVVVSLGGLSQKDVDDLVVFFERRSIPLAINHCVAAYPTEDHELELSQIDYLRARYAGHPIGLSTHEYHDWSASLLISYGKGVRLFERHVDINSDGFEPATYSSLPHQIDEWFHSFERARVMCGNASETRLLALPREREYLDSYVRGVYAKRDLAVGEHLTEENIYLAIPLQKGQLSCRELMLGQFGHVVKQSCSADQAVTIDTVDTPYSENDEFRRMISERGL